MEAQYIDKANIFIISNRGLLMFSEPDFPDIPLQVPGGTVEQGERPEECAKREFFEETGLVTAEPFIFLETIVTCSPPARRHCFLLSLSTQVPQSWDHYEHHAHGQAPPILFRFIWKELSDAYTALPPAWHCVLDRVRQFLIAN